MADISELGIRINDADVPRASTNLDSFASSAAVAAGAVGKLETEAQGMGAAVGGAAAPTRRTTTEVQKLDGAADRASDSTRSLSDSITRLGAASQSTTSITAAQIDQVMGIGRAYDSARASADYFAQAMDASDTFDRHRASLDQVFAAQQRLKTIQMDVADAVRIGAVSQADANQVLAMAEAQLLRTGAAAQTVTTHSAAMGSQVANLGYQFNDIAVMMAAGQNPFMLAMQQGMQIGPVLTEMSKGPGILKGLTAAFMGMVNPVTLVTLGVIAGGAAFAQWLMGSNEAKEEAIDFTQRVEDLSQALDDYVSASERASAPLAALRSEWGEAAEGVQEYLDNLAKAEAYSVEIAFNRAIRQFGTEENEGNVLGQFGLTDQYREGRTERGGLSAEQEQLRQDALAFMAARDAFAASRGKTIDDQISSLAALIPLYEQMIEANGRVTEEENNQFRALNDLMLELERRKREMAPGSNEGAVIDEYTKNLQKAAELEGDLATAIEYRNRMIAEGNFEEAGRAGIAIDNIREQISQTIEAGDRVDEMRERAERLQEVLAAVELPGEEQLQRELTSIIEDLDEAKLNVDSLNEASVSSLESAFNGFNTVLTNVLTNMGLIADEVDSIGSSEAARRGALALHGTPQGDEQERIVRATAELAERTGLNAEYMLAIMQKESNMNPRAVGHDDRGRSYEGLIQFGGPERQQFNVNSGSSVEEQVRAAFEFMLARGLRPGMGLDQYYSTVLAGNPWDVHKGDSNNGGNVESISSEVLLPEWQTRLANAEGWLDAYGPQVEGDSTEAADERADRMAMGERGLAAVLEARTEALEASTSAEEEAAMARERSLSLLNLGLISETQHEANLRSINEGTDEYRDALQNVERVMRETETAQARYDREMAMTETLWETGQIDAETYAAKVALLREELAQAASTNILEAPGLDQVDEEVERRREWMEKFQGEIRGLSDEFASAIANASSFSEALSSIGDVVEDTFRRMAQSFLSNGIEQLMGVIFGVPGGDASGGTNILGSIVGALVGGGTGAAVGAPLDATGGIVTQTLGQDEDLGNAINTFATTPGVVNSPARMEIHVNSPTGNQEIQSMVAQGVQAGLGEYQKNEPERVQAYVDDPRMR